MPATSAPPPPSSIAPPASGVRHVIAVGGGRGGVGKSTLAVNLAVYLAQLGRTVLLVDADPAGAELHTLLGVEPVKPRSSPEDPDDDDLESVQTQVPGLRLVPQSYRAGSTVPTRPGRKPRWAHQLRQLEGVDYVLLDLGAGTSPASLDLFLGADLGLCVTTPEPPSVEAVYRFARALYQRLIRRLLVSDRFRLRLAERAMSELGPLPLPIELAHLLARYDANLGRMARTELSRLRLRLVVNGTRLRTDADLGQAMGEMAARYLGITLDHIGHVEQDDSAWLSVRKCRPLLVDNPTSKSAKNLERIARRVLALLVAREPERDGEARNLAPEEPTLYDILWTHRGATDEEIRRAYKRQRENFQTGSLPLTSLFSEERLRSEQARIEEAHDTLLDPLRRKSYDASVFPEEEEARPARAAPLDSALEAERAVMRRELSREINPETEFTGRLLSKVREAHGIELEDIAKATKISTAYLRAIEAEAFGDLPALVYTRGFVQELAKQLKLDATQVTKTYIKRLREWRAAGGESNP